MKFLKSFFKKKEHSNLFKKSEPSEFIDYDDNHDKEDFTESEKSQIKSIFPKPIFGQNTPHCVTLGRKLPLNIIDKYFFVVLKYKDEWFQVHHCALNNNEKKKFSAKDTYNCDTIEGVIDCIKYLAD
jgi:hypothetical protein